MKDSTPVPIYLPKRVSREFMKDSTLGRFICQKGFRENSWKIFIRLLKINFFIVYKSIHILTQSCSVIVLFQSFKPNFKTLLQTNWKYNKSLENQYGTDWPTDFDKAQLYSHRFHRDVTNKFSSSETHFLCFVCRARGYWSIHSNFHSLKCKITTWHCVDSEHRATIYCNILLDRFTAVL